MPKRTDIRKIMIIGSGPIVIGQACEFDYSGTQACKALRSEGYEVVLVNSNPATIMTDPAIAYNREEFSEAMAHALDASPVHEALVEESVLGWKEYELEVMRDHRDNFVVICSIENFDPMGVHTGDSITVAPAQTMTDKEYQRMRDAAAVIIREVGVETGGSNIQFALDPATGRMIVIEMNPRVIEQILEIISMNKRLASVTIETVSEDLLREAKRMGTSDEQLAQMWKTTPAAVRHRRSKAHIAPVYKRVDTCAAEFESFTPYMYSTYEDEDESQPNDRPKIAILGSGPNRIGQGIEFDYCCCHAAFALREDGYETIMVNCNPETVSTDYDTSDRLYFEPLTLEDVLS